MHWAKESSLLLRLGHAVPHCPLRQYPRVMCLLLAGVTACEGMPAYVASKHAALGLMRTAAAEYGPKGLRVNAICPGATGNGVELRLSCANM